MSSFYYLSVTVHVLAALIWLGGMFFLALVGASDTVSTILRNTIRQMATPDHLRGRMTSVNMIFFMGGPQLGEMEAGAVARGLHRVRESSAPGPSAPHAYRP